jgi:hypothetical protein
MRADEPRWDVLRKTLVSRKNGDRALYGNDGVFAVSKRRLSRRDARGYGVCGGCR